MKKYILSSDLNPKSLQTLESMGFEIIAFNGNPNVDKKIAHHADLSFFVSDKEMFIAKEMAYLAEKLVSIGYNINVIDTDLGMNYPYDVKLNCVSFGEYFLCNVDTVAECVLNCMKRKGKKIINVKQGYTKCSVIPVSDNAIITDDESILNKCRQNGIDVLKVSKGNVVLDGFDYGFIGGTAGVFDNMVVFNGDIFSHPDGKKIADFIKKHNKKPMSLADGELIDTGSLIFLTED